MGGTLMNGGRRPEGSGRARRWATGLALMVAAGGLTIAAGTGTAWGATGQASAPAPSCSHPVITAFAFHPRTVEEGNNATLEITIANCTGKAFSGSLETFGVLVCEVVDPIDTAVHLPRFSIGSTEMTYRAPNCTGQGHITGRLMNQSGMTISERVARLTIVAPPGG